MFKQKLKELRKEQGYTMDSLCDAYNKRYNGKMNKSTLSRYENGLQEPMFTVVKNLADIFSVTTDYLTDETHETDHKEKYDNNKLEETSANSEDVAFFRLKKGLEPYDIEDSDVDFLLTVMKAHKERNE